LNIKEAECILAHELSHVFNRDHWVNLFIHFSEIIYYFNPAAHILISNIKLERELKADSSACSYLREPLLYAKLILKIEESIGKVPMNVLPFFQQKKQLKRRIESVLQIKSSGNEFTSRIALIALCLSMLFFSSLAIKDPVTQLTFITEYCQMDCPIESLPNAKTVVQKNVTVGKKDEKQVRPVKRTPGKVIKKIQVDASEESITYDEGEEENYIAFKSDETDILHQIEREIKEDRNNRTTIIYEISKTEMDSEKVINGSNRLVPRQIRYYAPNETKTYIIIKSRNNTNFETEMDWKTPGRVRIVPGNRN
jgi:hypothetical protein